MLSKTKKIRKIEPRYDIKETPAIPRISVPKTLHKPHELVAITKKVIERNIIDNYGCFSRRREHMLHIRVSPDYASRALRIMNTIIKTAEKFGEQVVIEQQRYSYYADTRILIQGQKIKISLSEKTKRLKNPDTSSHKQYIFKPTEKLSLEIIEYDCDFQISFHDTNHTKLEDQLNDIFNSLYKVAEMKNHKDQLERWEKLRQSSHKKRRDKNKEALHARQQKIAELEVRLNKWNKAQQIRKYLKQLSKEAIANKKSIMSFKELNEWIRWCQKYADSIDPVKTDFT